MILDSLKATCAICDKPVDEMFWLDDFRTCNKICVVRCHGQEESCALDKQMIDDIAYNNIVSITAFNIKKLDEVKRIGDE